MGREWFEMKEICSRNLESVAWIPLRSAQDPELVGQFVCFQRKVSMKGALDGV